MKKIKILLPLILISAFLGGCQKYLDIKRASTDKFIETADDCQRLLDNYSAMNTNYPSDGEASADNYYIGTNAFPGSFGEEVRSIYTWGSLPGGQYTQSYNIIYRANLVLQALDFDKVKKSADVGTLNSIKGAALFFRAYALWNISQLYTKPYSSTAAQDPGLPARTSPDLNDKVGRGSVKETYNRIIQDLQEAVGLLSSAPPFKPSRPNKTAVYAMLARVYLSMEDYGQALTNANAALTLNQSLLDYSLLNANNDIPFDRFNMEDLFHSTMTGDYKGLLYPGDTGNPGAVIDLNLYNAYDNNDLRKTLFFRTNDDGTHSFKGNYEPSTDANLFNGLTTGEMFLTRAECYARAGNFPLAMKDLNDLLRTRWKKDNDKKSLYIDQSASTELTALNIILAERRKELAMRGQRWTDLRRLNKDARFKTDIFRKENGTGPIIATLPANDLRYVLLIPQAVIDQAGMQQNPR